MAMRASRLVNLLLLLQARGPQTAAQLAEELEVSMRTVYRDVEALAEAGVPIYAERGPAGGVRLVEGYRTHLTGLTTREAEALFLSGLPGPAAELGLGTVVAAARLKVMAALPPELRARAARIQSRFHLDAPGWFRQAEPLPSLELLASAVWESREVEVTYRRDERVERRRLGPLGLVLKGGTWYLVALSKGEPRTFRVSRIEDAVLGDSFERPAGFDLGLFWAASTARFEAAQAPVDVTVRVQPGARDALERAVGATAAATIRPAGRPDAAGVETLRFRHESLEFAYLDLLRLGGGAEAVAPAELRQRLEEAARGLAERYLASPGISVRREANSR
jgi:predicted DNA-binding transcriptional regulator YafY